MCIMTTWLSKRASTVNQPGKSRAGSATRETGTAARGAGEIEALLREVRTCFNRLKALAGLLHDDLGVNPSMRAVMETLYRDGPQTVPAIALAKGVSRQHIQTIVNGLMEAGRVAARDNPAHRRSPLHELTADGKRTFARIEKREKAPLDRVTQALVNAPVASARRVLATLNSELEKEVLRHESIDQ
jgi:DNA-binding MarR family transcriptional regulator